MHFFDGEDEEAHSDAPAKPNRTKRVPLSAPGSRGGSARVARSPSRSPGADADFRRRVKPLIR